MAVSLEASIPSLWREILLSQKPDFNAFIPTNHDGTSGFLYTAWEDRPAGISQLEIQWDSLQSVECHQQSNVESVKHQRRLGSLLWNLSPWGSPLFSEELYLMIQRIGTM